MLMKISPAALSVPPSDVIVALNADPGPARLIVSPVEARRSIFGVREQRGSEIKKNFYSREQEAAARSEVEGKKIKITLTMMKMIMTRAGVRGVRGETGWQWNDIVNLLSSVIDDRACAVASALSATFHALSGCRRHHAGCHEKALSS
jgi:hypothetical protein